MDTLELPVVAGDARGQRDERAITEPVPVATAGEPTGTRAGVPAPDRRVAAPRRPVDRPPLASRLFAALLGLGAALGAAALLLSDRAPGALRSLFGDRARRLWERIDASERVDLPPGSELPPTDFLVHIGIWAVVATLVGLAVWSWRGLFVAGVLLVASSAALELAQGRYAETRSVEARDAIANAIGIGAGLVVAAGCYVTWSAIAAAARRLRRS